MDNWHYYNHAIIKSLAPHEEPDTSIFNDKNIWSSKNLGEKTLLARWTTDYDCGYETNWWYCIKDEEFDISKLSSKRRYIINKGNKFFNVKKINPRKYKEDIYNVAIEAFSAYPEKYRPTIDKNKFFNDIDNFPNDFWGCFTKDADKLVGYTYGGFVNNCYNLSVFKTIPYYEKLQVNAALVYGLLTEMEDFLQNGGYICDGERPISHETNFQEYLIKYFGFRYAYCKLNIEYRPFLKPIINFLYIFRKLLTKLDQITLIHYINSVLRMEDFIRNK